jgi:hypothetical protein
VIDVTRTPGAPAGLAAGKLRARDVLERLHADFLGKCYLCESLVTLGGFEVDHRIPRSHDPSRALDWANLFPICDGCNKRRCKSYPEDGLLDPAGGDAAIATRLEQRIIDRYPRATRPGFRGLDPADRAAVNTAEELDHIHNDPGAIKAEDLRATIVAHQRRVFLACLRYRDGSLGDADRLALGEHLREMLSRRAPFTALTRAELSGLGPAITALFD